MDTLEKRMQDLSNEVEAWKQKCVGLEHKNTSLMSQVQQLQAQVKTSQVSLSLQFKIID